jgi:Nucleoside recognition
VLKILVPISLVTSLLAWSGWLDQLDFILEPLMGLVGLPAIAALPLIVGILNGPYGAIAAMAPLPLTVDEMTLLAIFLLISHNLIQEGVIQANSGISYIQATIFRLAASVATVMAVSWFMSQEATVKALVDAPVTIKAPFLSMLKTWAVSTLVLSGKILVIIITLMILLELMRKYNVIDGMVGAMAPLLKVLGLGRQTGFMWLTAAIFGLTYGAAVIMTEAKEDRLSKEDLEKLHISIGINHSMIEDPLLFLSLGLNFFWLSVPRLVAAIIAVHLYILFNRLKTLPGLSRFSAKP